MKPYTRQEIDNFAKTLCERQNNQGTVKIPRFLGEVYHNGYAHYCVSCKDLTKILITDNTNCHSGLFDEARLLSERLSGTNGFSRRKKLKRSKRSKRSK